MTKHDAFGARGRWNRRQRTEEAVRAPLRQVGADRPWTRAALAALLIAGAVGCNPDENEGGDTGTDTETVPDLEAPDPKDDREWRVETVETGGVGALLDLEVTPEGGLAAAYFSTRATEDGPCDRLGDDPPIRQLFPLHYATSSGGGWSVETVYEPPIVGGPKALDLEYGPDGKASVATMSGKPLESLGYCGVHDLAWMVRDGGGSWSSETAVTKSGEASTDETSNVSDFGEVVGPWASLTFDEGEPIIAYKDIHQGGRQSSDTKRADLEFARRSGGGWEAFPVDWGRGAGNGADIGIDGDGRLVIAYLLPVERQTADQLGVWVARSSDGGETWTKTRIYGGATPSSPSMVVREDGRIHVLIYNANRAFPQLMTLTDPSTFDSADAWETTDIGDGQYDEGYNPSLARTPDGGLAATYRRCGRASGSLGECKRAEDGVVFSHREDGNWTQEFVAGGDDAFCGHVTSLVFADGSPTVAFRCNVRERGEVAAAVQVARPESD